MVEIRKFLIGFTRSLIVRAVFGVCFWISQYLGLERRKKRMQLTWTDLFTALRLGIQETWPKEQPYSPEIQEYLRSLNLRERKLRDQNVPPPPGATCDLYRELGKIYVEVIVEKNGACGERSLHRIR